MVWHRDVKCNDHLLHIFHSQDTGQKLHALLLKGSLCIVQYNYGKFFCKKCVVLFSEILCISSRIVVSPKGIDSVSC